MHDDLLKYGSMTLGVEVITPAIAHDYLRHNDKNRRIRKSVVAQYARDMRSGNWHEKPVAICFDQSGLLGNGQHTLSAIMESGRSQKLLVARNVPRESIAAMDIGLRRSIADVSNFVGLDLNRREAAIARVLAFGIDDNMSRSFEELLQAYIQHEDAIRWVIDRSKSKVTGLNSSVLSVVAMAWYTADRRELERFLQILADGVSANPWDKNVILLRDFCRGLKGGNSPRLREEVFRKAQSALGAFIDRRVLSKVYGSATQRFLVP